MLDFEKSLDYCDRMQQTTMHATNNDNSWVVYTCSLLCVFVLQYGNKFDFISTGVVQMGATDSWLGLVSDVRYALRHVINALTT